MAMRFIVKADTKGLGKVRVIADDVQHACEAGAIMVTQSLINVVVLDLNSGLESPLAEFERQHGMESAGATSSSVQELPTG